MAKKNWTSGAAKGYLTPQIILYVAFGIGLGLVIPFFLIEIPERIILGIGVIFIVIGVFGNFCLKKK